MSVMSMTGKKQFRKHLEMPPIREEYIGTGKLSGKAALITGGDSGIGRAVAVHFAREGADIAIVYEESDGDAKRTQQMIEKEGQQCLLVKGDLSSEAFCNSVIKKTIVKFGRLDVLVNNAGMHKDTTAIEAISKQQLLRTFSVNIFPLFYLVKAALKHMTEDSTIINTASVTAYRGSEHLMDYAATKGAIVSFTRSLAQNLADKKIRVNAVAPGPIWTPLVIEAFDNKQLRDFGKDTPMGRAGFPYEVAPAYVYLASADSSYVTGQVIHVNGGEMVNG
jgi:NAD(P)-dependent dehydrogenase (short-subunit alcohol dehydrogenase family)